MSTPCSSDVAGHRVRRKEEYVSVTTGGQDDCVCSVRCDLARHQVTHNDSGTTTVNDHCVDEFGAIK